MLCDYSKRLVRKGLFFWLGKVIHPEPINEPRAAGVGVLAAGRGAKKGCCWPTAWYYMPEMKSAYELAMERLNKTAPTVKLSAAQKAEIADLESQYAAKIAGREIALKAEMAKVADDPEKAGELQQQLAYDRKKLQTELEEKKERVRLAGGK